jgi:hypothetical protein
MPVLVSHFYFTNSLLTARLQWDLSFCTLGHREKYVKDKKEHNPNYLTWKSDGENGPNDLKCSEFYLVDWLASKERYMCWCDPLGALTKFKVCEDIAEMIRNKGGKKPLGAECIYNKIPTSRQKRGRIMTNMLVQRPEMV